MDTPHVQIILDCDTVPPPLQTALNRLQVRVSIRSLNKALQVGVSPSVDVCVILAGDQGSSDVLDKVLAEAANQACTTLVIPSTDNTNGPSDTELYRLIPPGAEQSSALNVDELTGRIKTLCEIRHPMRKMHEELIRLRQRDAELTANTRYFDEQLKLAKQIQDDLLSGPILDTDPLSVSTLYLPAEHVSGDTYDISRLDEDQLSFAIADATGHGMPAALLTIFIKNSFRGKELVRSSPTIIEPDELLCRLNDDLLNANLTQCQFITGLYAIFDRNTGGIRWARGGLPYPILIRPGDEPRQFFSEGGLIGALEEQSFEMTAHEFESGDTLLFYTDGLEALLLERGASSSEHSILDSPWIDQLAIDGPEAAFGAISEQAHARDSSTWFKDDITAIAIKMS